MKIPHGFGTPEYDLEKVKKAEQILSQTDKCPTPNQLENGGCLFGVLQNLWDHIENNHPKGFEWLG